MEGGTVPLYVSMYQRRANAVGCRKSFKKFKFAKHFDGLKHSDLFKFARDILYFLMRCQDPKGCRT